MMNKFDMISKDTMSRMEDIMNSTRLDELLHRKEEKDKEENNTLWAPAIIGVVAAAAGIAYAVYRFFTPDYLGDFGDDFEDDFDDGFFEDETEDNGQDRKESVFDMLSTLFLKIENQKKVLEDRRLRQEFRVDEKG